MTIKFILRQTHSSAADDSMIGEYVFDGSLFTIGSDPGGTIVIAESAPEQAVVVEDVEHLTLINSAEGTNLNGRDLPREAIEPLAVGDEIKIGKYVISVAAADEKNLNGANNFKTNSISSSSSLPVPPTPAPLQTIAAAQSPLSPPNGKNQSPSKNPARNFADILNTLRTEEDSFYFIVENGTREEKRIPLEQTEMPLGFDARGEIACAVEQIAALYAVVRKDWSGIIVESQRGGAVLVNDEAIQTTRRLRNGDRVSFNARRKDAKKSPSLKLHEPSSLVALESIMGNRSGESVNFGAAGNLATNDVAAAPLIVPIIERNFFGYFSFFEIAAMAIGTLIAAVLIFLLLELMVG